MNSGGKGKEQSPQAQLTLQQDPIINDDPGNTRHRQDVEPISNQERDFKYI